MTQLISQEIIPNPQKVSHSNDSKEAKVRQTPEMHCINFPVSVPVPYGKLEQKDLSRSDYENCNRLSIKPFHLHSYSVSFQILLKFQMLLRVQFEQYTLIFCVNY